MFHIRCVIGPFIRGVLLPNALGLSTSSPVFGSPTLISVQPGSYASSTPGAVNFGVPNYITLTITLRAAGGGGGTAAGGGIIYATDGGASQFSTATPVIANGGLAGPGDFDGTTGPPPDQGGSGGVVTVGGGGAGGLGIDASSGAPYANANGSAGGRVTKTWNRTDSGAPAPGAIIALYLGQGGQPGSAHSGLSTFTAYPGQNGSVNINWS